MTVLITGANGFIGSHLCLQVSEPVVRVARYSKQENVHSIGNFLSFSGWDTLLQDIDVVVHLAARVHHMQASDIAEDTTYQRDNVDVTHNLVKAAARNHVRRFIYLSTIKVNGESTQTGKPFSPKSLLNPSDSYARSKVLAEQEIEAACNDLGIDYVVIRPPLVYGPGVKANFMRLLNLSRMPLPFKSIHNCRDMVSVFNLCDLINVCIEHPAAKNQTFLVSDGEPYSLSGLLKAMSQAQDKQSWLWPFPKKWLQGLLNILGKQNVAQRLFGNLEIDISHTTETLDWQPKYSLEYTLRKILE